jgi:recombinational DNA repair protein (RecF pathway)
MSARREVVTEGFVLARASAGEGSARVLFYTKELGLVSALAKSAREERSQLRPHLLPGSSGIFRLVKGRDTWRVTGASRTTDSYFSLAGKKNAQDAAQRVLQGVRQFVHGEGADPELFSGLHAFFDSLHALPDEYAPDAENIAILKLLAGLGYVRGSPALSVFMGARYSEDSLSRAHTERSVIVRAINEAIHASGL